MESTKKQRRVEIVRKSVAYILLLGVPSLGFTAEDMSNDFLLDDLLQELDNVTAIATRTKLNVDYVPGMVTVLHGVDLQRQGIHSLAEALQTVPGIEVSVSNDGRNQIVMRGIGKSFASGKIKMLVNGRAMNVAQNAASAVEAIPLQLVERIEIIRGPGSAIYGEYAYAGVVNVTIRKDAHIFYSGSHHGKHTIGGSLSNHQSDAPFKYALSLSAHDNVGKQVTAGPDYLKVLSTGAPSDNLFNSISTSPGYSNEVERVFTSALQVSYKDFEWDSFFQQRSVGDYFGFQNALPAAVETNAETVDAASDLDAKITMSNTLSGLASAGARYYALRGTPHTFLPAGFPDKVNGGFFDDGVIGSPNYTEYEAHGSLEFYYSGINKHDILFGLHGTYIKQGNTWARRNSEISNGSIGEVPLQDFRGDKNFLTEGNSRKIASIYAQDQWNIADHLTVTIGGRYDNYFEIGNSFNPRVAAVYHFMDNHILKFQLSRAFRPPTFLEMYLRNNIVAEGNADIKPEIIQTVEGGYIYHNAITSFRLTTFYSQMNDLITNDDATKKYQNLESVISRGAEVEFSQKINVHFTFSVNGTYVNVKDKSSGEALPNIANIFGNATLLYQPTHDLKVIFSDQYIGERKRAENDPRDALGAYHVFNATINLDHVMLKQVSINFGLKNVLDQVVSHPSPLISFAGNLTPSYEDDYPRPGRELWLNLVYKY